VRRALSVIAVVVAATALGVAGRAPSYAAPPRPVLHADFPDPAVVSTPRGLVAYATGGQVPHAWARSHQGRWRLGGPVLVRRPTWAMRDGAIWAVDVAQARGRWVLYFAAPVRGIVERGRCIGVAVADGARGPFRPVGAGPLVCPSYAATPPAQDQLLPRDRSLPRAGVIDPSFHRDPTGAYLLYKTDRVPSTIRLLPLTDDGRRVRPGAGSVELLRSVGVVENPVLSRRAGGWTMLVSVGDYTRCSYRTDWYRSADLLDWTTATTGRLLDRSGTGLCGPGGADLVDVDARRSRVYLHGWTCHRRPRPCQGAVNWELRPRSRALRSLYAATLTWGRADGIPRVGGWVGG
jgi:arabinan endo-1,5-alpha-L-arabinosidase